MGYRKRTSFLAGLTVAQISEFSLVFAGLGLAVGHINEEIVGLITLVGLITIGLSTYLILYSHQIYDFLAPVLNIFQRKDPYRETDKEFNNDNHYDLIIFGLGRFGNRIGDILDESHDINYLGVDFDPHVVQKWQEKGRNVMYGDLEDPEILLQISYQNAKCIISTVTDKESSMQLSKVLRRNNYRGALYLTALNEKDYKFLNESEADQVLLPHQLAATSFYNNFLNMLLTAEKLDQK